MARTGIASTNVRVSRTLVISLKLDTISIVLIMFNVAQRSY
jgi:hypothetical protein